MARRSDPKLPFKLELLLDSALETIDWVGWFREGDCVVALAYKRPSGPQAPAVYFAFEFHEDGSYRTVPFLGDGGDDGLLTLAPATNGKGVGYAWHFNAEAKQLAVNFRCLWMTPNGVESAPFQESPSSGGRWIYFEAPSGESWLVSSDVTSRLAEVRLFAQQGPVQQEHFEWPTGFKPSHQDIGEGPDGEPWVCTVDDFRMVVASPLAKAGDAASYVPVTRRVGGKNELSNPLILKGPQGPFVLWRANNGKMKRETRDAHLEAAYLIGRCDAVRKPPRLFDDREVDELSGVAVGEAGSVVFWRNGYAQRDIEYRLARVDGPESTSEAVTVPWPIRFLVPIGRSVLVFVRDQPKDDGPGRLLAGSLMLSSLPVNTEQSVA